MDIRSTLIEAIWSMSSLLITYVVLEERYHHEDKSRFIHFYWPSRYYYNFILGCFDL